MKNIYLDYSATTPVDKEVLDTFTKVNLEYIGNPNSLHKLGLESKKLMDASIKQISNILGVLEDEVIFTSGASESNNLAIFGVVNKYPNRGRHIITTKLEHSSVLEAVKYLETKGYVIDYVKLDKNGLVDLDDLERLLSKDTVLVSICHVNSEIGIKQDINAIGKIIKKYPTTIFHVDGTQAVGKINIDLSNVDLYSLSAHKFYGLKGCGLLIKKDNIEIDPIIHGGKSQTNYRSGTPALSLIVATSKALRLIYNDLDKKYDYVLELNEYLKNKLKNNTNIIINSNEVCIPHILNISIPGIKPETMLHALEEENIFISTKTACSKDNSDSLSLTALGYDHEISGYSIRISLSYKTTYEEIDRFVSVLDEKIKELKF